MRASEMMHTPAELCAPSTTLRETAQLMVRRHVGSVIVNGDVGEVAGIVTDRDVVLWGVAECCSADAPVDTVMTRNLATVDVDVDIAEPAATMMEPGVRLPPVTDATGDAHGLVPCDDLVRHCGDGSEVVSELLARQWATTSVED